MEKKGLAKALERKMGLDEGLLTKIKTKEVESSLLMNAKRREIFQFICQNPCVHLREISRALNFSTHTASWHLRKMKEKKLITATRIGNKMVFCPLSELIDSDECRTLALFYREHIKRIYLHLRDNPGKTQKELFEELDIYQQLLSRALIAMQSQNVISQKKQGRVKVYFVTDLLDRMEKDFELKIEDFEGKLFLALNADGVDPKITHNGDFFRIDLDSGGRKRSILEIPINPVTAVLS